MHRHKVVVSSGMVCKNCTHTFAGLYCYHCGQPARTSRITVNEILSNSFISVVKVNRGLLFTVIELSRRPGKVIQNYLAGQRVAYYAPHEYLFFVGAITTFLTTRYHSFSNKNRIVGAFRGSTHAFLNSFFQYADTHATLINIVSIPVFAFFSFLLFQKSHYNYAEHLVLNTYITSQKLLLFIFWLPFTQALPMTSDWLLGLYILLTLLYNLWVYVQFGKVGIFRSVVAMMLAYAGQFLLNLFFFYWGKGYL